MPVLWCIVKYDKVEEWFLRFIVIAAHYNLYCLHFAYFSVLDVDEYVCLAFVMSCAWSNSNKVQWIQLIPFWSRICIILMFNVCVCTPAIEKSIQRDIFENWSVFPLKWSLNSVFIRNEICGRSTLAIDFLYLGTQI